MSLPLSLRTVLLFHDQPKVMAGSQKVGHAGDMLEKKAHKEWIVALSLWDKVPAVAPRQMIAGAPTPTGRTQKAARCRRGKGIM